MASKLNTIESMKRKLRLLVLVATILISLTTLLVTRTLAQEAGPSGVAAVILERINSVRLDPWSEAERLGYDIDLLRKEVGPVVAEIWDQGLEPLTWNQELAQAAENHIQDMLEHLYYSHVSLDGSTPLDRIKKVGAQPLFCSESMGAVAFENVISVEEAANLILDGLFNDAFAGGEEGAPLLDHVLTEIGLHFFGGRLSFDNVDLNVFVFTADLMIPDPRMESELDFSGSPFEMAGKNGNGLIWGRVYKDINGNGEYDKGEELPRQTIVLQGPLGVYGPVDPSWTIATGSSGWFVQMLPVGEYNLEFNYVGIQNKKHLSVEQGVLPQSLDIVVF